MPLDDRSREDRGRSESLAYELLRSLPPSEADVIVRYYHDGQTETDIELATGFTITEQQHLRRRVRLEFLARLHSRGDSGDAQ